MTGEPDSDTRRHKSRRLLSLSLQTLLLALVCALALISSAALAGAASKAAPVSKFPARLTLPEFAISQSNTVKLIYKFPKPSKSFSYRLSVKKGSSWPTLKSVRQKGNFRGRKTMTVSKIFAGRWVKPGYYRLQLTCASGSTLLTFKVVPFSGNLTRNGLGVKSFTLAQAGSIKFTYAFSKPSKSFAYQLTFQKGSKWQLIKRAKTVKKTKRLYFRGVRTVSLKSLFGRKAIVLGSYRLKISCAYSTRLLTFKVVKSAGPAITIAGFTITGGINGLALGQTKPIGLTLSNPHNVSIFVTQLNVTVSADSTPSGCASASNLRITQSNASSENPIAVPAKGSVTLTSAPRAPQITFLNLPDVNQDVCKNKSFDLTFSGSAHS